MSKVEPAVTLPVEFSLITLIVEFTRRGIQGVPVTKTGREKLRTKSIIWPAPYSPEGRVEEMDWTRGGVWSMFTWCGWGVGVGGLG